MRPLDCFIAISFGGYIAGPAGMIDWLCTEQTYQKQKQQRAYLFNRLRGG
jgi:hypothetical protein